jgi:nicotinamidase-related amidase
VALDRYVATQTGLLLVDAYNDFLSEGGKLWPKVRAVAESIELLDHLRLLIAAARSAGVVVFHVPHRRWREGNYDGWRYLTPSQITIDREAFFAEGTWGGEWHPELAVQPGDVTVAEHWGHDGFANTDLDLQLKQRGIEKIILVGVAANTCVEGTARHGAELGYHVTLVLDATAAIDPEAMRAAHEINAPVVAHAVLTTDAVIAALVKV